MSFFKDNTKKDREGLPFDPKALPVGESFIDYLYRLLDRYHYSRPPEMYRKAGISPDKWSKYKNQKVLPKKDVVLAIALSMELTLAETEELLSRSNNAFSKSSLKDELIRQCIQMRYYDIRVINEELHNCGEEPLEV